MTARLRWLGYWLGPGGDGLTLLLSVLVLFSATWLLERAGWQEDMPSLGGIAASALVLGFVLARSGIRPLACHLLAGVVGAGLTVFFAVWAMPLHGWANRVLGLMQELEHWGKAVVGDVIRDGNIEFLMVLVALFWSLGYLAGWHILRRRQAWGLVIPAGVVVLIALAHLPEQYYFHFLLYLLAAVLLLVHVNLLRRQWEWGRQQVGYHPVEGVARLGFVAVFGLLSVFVAWKAPATESAPLGVVMDVARSPWEFVQDQFSRLFSALPAKKPFITLRWGNTLAFGSPPQLSNQVLFTVESRESHYWRAKVYDTYTQLGWSSSPTITRLLDNDLPPEEGPLALRTRTTHSVRLNAATDTLFMAGQPVRSSLPAMVVTRPGQAADVFAVRSGPELRLSQKYTVTSSVSVARPEHLRQAGADYPRWVVENYLQLPASFSPRVRRLSRELTAQDATDYDKVIAIRDYLKTLPYNLNVKAPPPGRDGVDYFLFSQKVGYCDYYASAMVTMLRSVRVPARFVVGYATGEWDNGKKAHIVRELHYHSWVEAYFPGYGWVEFEPTPPEAVEFTNQPPLGSSSPVDLEPDEEGAVVEDEPPAEMLEEDTGVLRWLLGGGIPFAGLVMALGWYRWWGRLVRLGYPAEVYAKMCRLGSLARLSPEPQTTPAEYSAQLSARLPHQAEAIRCIADSYGRTRYGPRKLLRMEEQEEVARAWRQLRPALLRYWIRPKKG